MHRLQFAFLFALTAAAVKAAGGTVAREAAPFGNSGIFIALRRGSRRQPDRVEPARAALST